MDTKYLELGSIARVASCCEDSPTASMVTCRPPAQGRLTWTPAPALLLPFCPGRTTLISRLVNTRLGFPAFVLLCAGVLRPSTFLLPYLLTAFDTLNHWFQAQLPC
jgi:hypothetical protein